MVVAVLASSSVARADERVFVASNPFGVALGFYDAGVSVAVSGHAALHLDVTRYDLTRGLHRERAQGYEVDVGVALYLGRTFHGAFVEPGFMLRSTETVGYYEGHYGGTTMGPQVLLGYHLTWQGGFSVAAALGGGWNAGDENVETDWFAWDHVFANGYLRIGYAF
jgi:hypothetical protein